MFGSAFGRHIIVLQTFALPFEKCEPDEPEILGLHLVKNEYKVHPQLFVDKLVSIFGSAGFLRNFSDRANDGRSDLKSNAISSINCVITPPRAKKRALIYSSQNMDDVTLPRSFDDTTPAEMMKDYPRRRLSRPSHSPVPEPIRQPQNYGSIAPENSNLERNLNTAEESASGEREESDEEVYHEWFGKQIWRTFREWERNHWELVLENKQSVARDHLANERTYLAWLRTSLSFASIGVAITQLFRLSTTIQSGAPPKGFAELRRLGRPLGATFIGIAALVLALGVHRYFISQYWMTKGKFPASRGAVLVVSVAAITITVVAFSIVIIVDPDLQK